MGLSQDNLSDFLKAMYQLIPTHNDQPLTPEQLSAFLKSVYGIIPLSQDNLSDFLKAMYQLIPTHNDQPLTPDQLSAFLKSIYELIPNSDVNENDYTNYEISIKIVYDWIFNGFGNTNLSTKYSDQLWHGLGTSISQFFSRLSSRKEDKIKTKRNSLLVKNI